MKNKARLFVPAFAAMSLAFALAQQSSAPTSTQQPANAQQPAAPASGQQELPDAPTANLRSSFFVWTVLGASRGESGILGEGIRQALLRDPAYERALERVGAMVG